MLRANLSPPPSEPVLVTGAGGFIGAKVVEILLQYGCEDIRCFVRPSTRMARLNEVVTRAGAADRVRVVTGDLISPKDCARAAKDTTIVYHLAAGFDKSFAGAFMTSVIGTRNLVEAVLGQSRLKCFVNISSFAVYSTLHMKRGSVIDENCPLEDDPQERYDPYGFGKLKQEELVREYGRTRSLPYVILRPGAVFGPGKRDLSGRVGIDTFGVFLQVGGSNLLPLSFVDNCAEAIVLAGLTPEVIGETFNVVDDELITARQFLAAYRNRVGRLTYIRVPYSFGLWLCWFWETYSRRSKGQVPPAFNRRRCAAEWKPHRFSNDKLKRQLHWKPRVGLQDALSAFLGQFEARS